LTDSKGKHTDKDKEGETKSSRSKSEDQPTKLTYW